MLINLGLGLAGRLAAGRAGALVGRDFERSVLDRMLSGVAGAPLVAYVHGSGGIGKSSLLRYAAARAEFAGREVVRVDGRLLNADPRRMEDTAALACVEPGVVLLVDAFEHSQRLESWLRDTFLPRLAEGTVVVLASRIAADAEWTLDPGWAQVFTALALRPLDAVQSEALLAARNVAPDRRAGILAFAGGSPLALSLATSAPTGEVLTTLVERLVGDLPGGAHRRALDVLAQAHVTREELLRAVLGDEDAATAFSWLRRQPYVETTPHGLRPHVAVRSALAADLRWRDPERYEEVRTRLSVACLNAVRRAAEADAPQRAAEWMFLFRDQADPRELYDWQDLADIEDTPLGPADPVIAALWEHVETAAPLREGEHLGVRRTVATEMRSSGREVVAVEVDGRTQHVFSKDWRRQPGEQWVEDGVHAAAPTASWGPETADLLPRKAFEEGVLEALRTWRAPREFATSVLLRSHLVPPESADPVADLRDRITSALDALRVDAAGVKAHDTLVATYISASSTHKATARRLGVPYGTYRRHLALAKERLVAHLLAR
ncbi:ATP-binding protein [Lentzea sp. NEAU-D7]|uniref:ATP-binding protein n=1 Tax=Lentzea sp. NEAU-D7 TaxID=2994667 RepID=UPI00224A5E23|nr:ATP-binding protein [Lentzea sp. NEAU-D7]MCX2955333.1 ATP-binding protein [Lentzea sp. NEAU-D7]